MTTTHEPGVAITGVPLKTGHVVTSKVADDTVLIPVHKGAADLDNVFFLNSTAAFLWEHIDGKRSVADLVDIVTECFDVDHQTALVEVDAFVEDLRQRGLMVPDAASPHAASSP